MTKIAIVTGSTRPGRVNLGVAEWVLAQAQLRSDAEFELVDIADFNLPLLDEAYPAAYQNYTNDHTKKFGLRRSPSSTATCSSPVSTTTRSHRPSPTRCPT